MSKKNKKNEEIIEEVEVSIDSEEKIEDEILDDVIEEEIVEEEVAEEAIGEEIIAEEEAEELVAEEEIIVDEETDESVVEETVVEEVKDDKGEEELIIEETTTSIEEDEEVTIDDKVTLKEDGTVIEEVTITSNTDDEEPSDTEKDSKKLAIFFVVAIVVLIGALFFARGMTDNNDSQHADEVDQVVYSLQAELADEESNEPVQEGDVTVIDFVGYLDGKKFEGGEATDFRLKIGSGQFIPGFEEQLIGKKKGDKVDVNVIFPEEYGNPELAGKDVTFKVTIKNIFILPELDDEFAQKVVEFLAAQGYEDAAGIKTYKELRQYIANVIAESYAQQQAVQ